MKGDVMKQKRIWLLVAELALICVLVGCAPAQREKLNLLEVGMTKREVLKVMGTPYKTEAKGENEWLLYKTGDQWHVNTLVGGYGRRPERAWLTPLQMQNGKLLRWGGNLWATKDRIDQTIKQK
jgi:hypothetical protein